MTAEKEVLGRKLAQMVAQGLVSWIIEATGKEWPCTEECWICRRYHRGDTTSKPKCPRPSSMSKLPPCYSGEDWKQKELNPPTIRIAFPETAEVCVAS